MEDIIDPGHDTFCNIAQGHTLRDREVLSEIVERSAGVLTDLGDYYPALPTDRHFMSIHEDFHCSEYIIAVYLNSVSGQHSLARTNVKRALKERS